MPSGNGGCVFCIARPHRSQAEKRRTVFNDWNCSCHNDVEEDVEINIDANYLDLQPLRLWKSTLYLTAGKSPPGEACRCRRSQKHYYLALTSQVEVNLLPVSTSPWATELLQTSQNDYLLQLQHPQQNQQEKEK